MKRLFTIGSAVFVSSLAASAFMACSDADDSESATPDGSVDSPSSVPSNDGGVDASPDGDASADVDAAAATCTAEGWCHIDVPDNQTLVGVWGDGKGVIWTVSAQGNILRWDGKTWVQSYSAGAALFSIWGSGPTDLWAGGAQGLFHGTGASPNALTWTSVRIPAPVTGIYSIWGSAANDIVAVGDSTPAPQSNPDTPDYVLHYTGPTDAGGWAIDPISTGKTNTYFQGVWGTSASDVWLIGIVDSPDPAIGSYLARLLHRQSTTWKDVAGPDAGGYGTPAYGGASITATDVWLVGIENTSTDCWTYSGAGKDGGTFTWTPQNPDPLVESGGIGVQDLAVWGTGPNDVWKGGQYGRLRHWDGTTWTIARIAIDNEIPVQNTIYGIWGSGPADVWVVGDGIALHKGTP